MCAPAAVHYVTAAALAEELGCNVQTIQKAFRTGDLEGRKVGHDWTTTRDAVARWLHGGNQTTRTDGDVTTHADGSECLWSITDQIAYRMHPLYPLTPCPHPDHPDHPAAGQQLPPLETKDQPS